MANKKSNLVSLIRKLIQEEVQKAIRPAINEILAEHFLKTISREKTVSSLMEAPESQKQAPQKQAPPKQKKASSLNINKAGYRQQILENLGVVGQPEEALFADIDPNDMPASSGGDPNLPPEIYQDDDTEGVDVESLMGRQ